MLPRNPVNVRSGRSQANWARRRTDPVATVAPGARSASVEPTSTSRGSARGGTAATWYTLGYAHRHLGHHDRAVECYQQSLRLFRELGYRVAEAETLTDLGDTYLDAGDTGAARVAWQQALAVLTDLDDADSASVRARLDALPDAPVS